MMPSESEIAREMADFPQFKDRPDVCIRRIRDHQKIRRIMAQRKASCIT